MRVKKLDWEDDEPYPMQFYMGIGTTSFNYCGEEDNPNFEPKPQIGFIRQDEREEDESRKN